MKYMGFSKQKQKQEVNRAGYVRVTGTNLRFLEPPQLEVLIWHLKFSENIECWEYF
jgi:hypothetical protein